jgi:amino acid transporter
LLATSCGTAIASVCALGLFQIERLLGGIWSVAAVLTAGVCCFGLARACARLSDVVPSGAGPLAFVSRGLGRKAGLVLVLPYLLLTLFLVGAEAMIVGVVLGRLLSLPIAVGAVGFLIGTWGLCRAGVRISYRAQALATWALIGGLCILSLLSLQDATHRGALASCLLPSAPDVGAFVAGVGQALFLFMGFELVTTQVELVRTPSAIASARSSSRPSSAKRKDRSPR